MVKLNGPVAIFPFLSVAWTMIVKFPAAAVSCPWIFPVVGFMTREAGRAVVVVQE